jgi:eukaryotic-like serine/threonine-protein kinase
MNTPDDLIGRTFHGKYVITDVLGEGAMGVVYRGFDEASLDEVAIKVLLPSLSVHEEVVTRFHREASAARRVDHEGTVRILGRGAEGGLHYLVMELLHGKSLATVLAEERRLPESRALRLLIQLCGALAVAHERGVVHRDIKPENIMVIEGVDHLGERMKLLDFGIAKRMERTPSRPNGIEDSFNQGEETRHGALIGTPEYMAPEQCMGCDVDARTDLYACGVLLYRMVTGQVPFDGTDAHPFELCQRHIGEEPAAPSAIYPAIRPAVEAIILKALRKAPSARHQTAVELRNELSRALADLEHIETEHTERMTFDRLDLTAEAADLEEPVLVPLTTREEIASPAAVVEPLPAAGGSTTQITQRRARRAVRSPLQSYLPTVALAAVIGAAVGSLLMVLAPFVQR